MSLSLWPMQLTVAEALAVAVEILLVGVALARSVPIAENLGIPWMFAIVNTVTHKDRNPESTLQHIM